MVPESKAPFESPHIVVSFMFLAESRQLVLIMAGGDIAVLSVDQASESPEVGESWRPPRDSFHRINLVRNYWVRRAWDQSGSMEP